MDALYGPFKHPFYANELPPPPNPKPPVGIMLPHKRPGEPGRFRFGGTIKYIDKLTPPEQTVRFQFRSRIVSATGTLAHPWHSSVLRLRVHPSRIGHFIGWLVKLLPVRVGSCVRTAFPEWFLPPNIILKIEKQDEDHEGMFDTEVEAYRLLRPLQGVTVPRCYGLARYNGMRSLVLQDLGGACLSEPAGLTLDLPELSSLLQSCQRELHAYEVHQADPRPGNFRLVGGKLMALDFEMAVFDLTAEKKAVFMETNVEHIADTYRELQLMEWKHGNLEAA